MPEGTFQSVFGGDPAVHADAPGRVNLIGEHTDYHDGFVLPCAIPQRTWVQLRGRNDRRVRVYSATIGEDVAEFTLGAEAKRGDWVDYVQGVTWAAAAAGAVLGGMDIWLRSDVPLGSGLSSSAALEVSLLRGFRSAFSLDLDDVRLALLGQQAEVGFVGAPVGIMDQMASSLASGRTALFLDTRTLEATRVELPADAEILVINSGLTHSHAGGEYVTRRRESEDAARALGVQKLRDIDVSMLDRVEALPEPQRRRARHVVTENRRVLDARDALLAGDLASLGRLMGESHVSMRDDYEISTPEIDTLVALASKEPEVIGARMTGGGFGGCVVILTRSGAAADAGARIAAAYGRSTGRRGVVVVPPDLTAEGGAPRA